MQSPMKEKSLPWRKDRTSNASFTVRNDVTKDTMSAEMSDKFTVTDGVEDGVDDSDITKDKLRGCAQGVVKTAAHP